MNPIDTIPESLPRDARQDDAQTRILDAALTEFSIHGLAGARTETIAAAAGVNKALIYYYFQSKEKLYEAALEKAAARVLESSLAVFESKSSAGERLLRMALNHFDRILTQQEFQQLMQQEMIRRHQQRVNPAGSGPADARKSDSGALSLISKKVFAPLTERFQRIAIEGIASGELIPVDWMQLVLAAIGANVFYFVGSAVWREVLQFDPFAPEVLAERRRSLVTYLGLAVFADRGHGAALAARILADSPMPEFNDKARFMGER
jgi:TetR/AcrR family transcriptional regulator